MIVIGMIIRNIKCHIYAYKIHNYNLFGLQNGIYKHADFKLQYF